MKNRMQDLDFEQTVAFDKVQDYEFTRRAAQRFRQVVSLDSFEDEDADVIFHYLLIPGESFSHQKNKSCCLPDYTQT